MVEQNNLIQRVGDYNVNELHEQLGQQNVGQLQNAANEYMKVRQQAYPMQPCNQLDPAESRISYLQMRPTLTEGERVEIEILLRRKWGHK